VGLREPPFRGIFIESDFHYLLPAAVMTRRSAPPFAALPECDDGGSGPRLVPALPKARDLATMKPGDSARILDLAVEADLAAWLRAVGLGEGEDVRVLRHAALGGPIHVRTAAGGEFALNRSLARRIFVRQSVTPNGEGGARESAA
jgi:Fe2+ transport system protein FeoA